MYHAIVCQARAIIQEENREAHSRIVDTSVFHAREQTMHRWNQCSGRICPGRLVLCRLSHDKQFQHKSGATSARVVCTIYRARKHTLELR